MASNQDNAVETYQVNACGFVHTVKADAWTVGNGLKFQLQGTVVAWFTDWDYFKLANLPTQPPTMTHH